MGKQSVIKVEVKKVFEYPKSMLDKTNFIDDALTKAQFDMQLFIDETMKFDHTNINSINFVYSATEELNYALRKNVVSDNEVISVYSAAKLAATEILEEKYGKFDSEINPHLFDYEPGEVVENLLGRTVRKEQYYLKEDISEELAKLSNEYVNLFKNHNSQNKTVKFKNLPHNTENRQYIPTPEPRQQTKKTI
jgi:hypothetical protein